MNPAELIYTCQAEDDLDAIFDYISKDSFANALKYINELKRSIENLSDSPYVGVNCRTKGIDKDCRMLIFEKYLIFYDVDEEKNQIIILRILHGARKYHALLT